MKADSRSRDDSSPLQFKTKAAWAAWLGKNRAVSSGVWLQLAKKSSGLESLSYDEALEVALCYG